MAQPDKITLLQEKIRTGVFTREDRAALYQAYSDARADDPLRRPTLSVCAIVKNEEKCLGNMLASVAGRADEIVICDTGSLDQSPMIAERYGARLYHIPWEGDFSKARNESLRRAAMEWILVLDADEVIGEQDWQIMMKLMEDNAHEMYSLPQTTYSKAQSFMIWQPNDLTVKEACGYEGYFVSRLVRLFRNNPDIQYRGIVHEHPFDTSGRLRPKECDARIHHYGKLKSIEYQEKKAEFYYALGLEKIKQLPNHAQAHYELAIQLLELKRDSESESYFKRALELDDKYHEARLVYADSLRRWGKKQAALQEYITHLRYNPNDSLAYIFASSLLIELKKYEAAMNLLDEAKKHPCQQPALIKLNEGVIAMNLGCFDVANNHLHEALRLQPNYEPILYNLACVAARKQEYDQAVLFLDRLLKRKPDDQEAGILLDNIKKIIEGQISRTRKEVANVNG